MNLHHFFTEEPTGEVAIIFGRFNPPHKGHKAAWKLAAKSPIWYVGTNKSTIGPKDPLPFDAKIKAMITMWPEVSDHIVAEQSWLTLASMVYKNHGDVVLRLITDEEWVGKTIKQYNGAEGPHGYYNFSRIDVDPAPRLSSATALRDAVVKGNRKAFAAAAGVSADTDIGGVPFFDLVAKYLLPYQDKVKAKKKTRESAIDNKMREDAAPGDIDEIVSAFVSSPIGKKYAKYDCKSVTRAFVKWAEETKIPVQVLSLAPPSAETIKQRPNLRGRSGEGDGHIMPVVNGQTVDFTVRQFGINRPYENPLITPISQVKQVYNKIGGYFTDKPEWFLGGKTHYLGPWGAMPANIMNMDFGDEILKESTKVRISNDPRNMGAWVDDSKQDEPTVNIPLRKIIAVLEPDELHQTKKGATTRIKKMVTALSKGKDTLPILVRKYKNGYQVLDGHHRFKAYKQAGRDTIPAMVVAAKNITDVTDKVKRGEKIEESKKASKAEANYQSHPKNGQKCINCTMWRDPHWCTAVAGKIAEDGWCDWFAAGARGKHGKITEDSAATHDLQIELLRTKDTSYDGIDALMKKIARRHDISPQRLHDEWMAKYDMTPDAWIKKTSEMRFPDGDIKVVDHFFDRLPREGAPLSKYQAARMITNAIKKHGDEIASMPEGHFVLRGKGNAGIVVHKTKHGKEFQYVIKTGHPDFQRTQTPGIVVEDELNIELHDELNPAIFVDGRMRPDVRENLLKIAEDFKDSLGIELEGLRDITISGSNAAYNYTPKSDVDLHLVVDVPRVDHDHLYRELFDAKKFKYNAEHDYKVRGYDVELYVQDANQEHTSQGIYSVLNDSWVSEPTRITAEIDRDAVRNKYDTIKNLINRAARTEDHFLADKLRRMIKKYRQVGLQSNGELGPENLAFKALRANGYIEKLYDLINDIKDRELSIEGEEILDEVSMTPGALADFAKTPVAQSMKIGFEAEMIVHHLDYEMEDEGGEPDYDADEGVGAASIPGLVNDLYRFFRDTTGRRTIERAVEQFNDQVMEYMEEQFQEYLEDEQQELRAKVKDQMSSEATDEEIDAEIDEQGSAYDRAVDSMRDDFYESWNDLDAALQRFDLEMMSDWAREYEWDWPYYTGGSESDEISQESMDAVAREISTALGGVRIKASTGYHTAKRDPEVWILETDSSINADPGEGDGGLELVSPPMPLAQGLEKLDQLFDWMQKGDVDTDSSTGFHMGVSIPDQTMDNIDHLKLILFLGDQHVLQTFGRSANNYTKSMLDKMEANIERLPNPAAAMDMIRQGLNKLALKTIGGLIIPKGDRYVSINIKDKYIEFRSAGGDYMNKQEQIKNTLLRYVRVMAIAADPEAEKVEYAKKLYKVLAANSTPEDADKLKLFVLHQQGGLSKEEFIKRLKARHGKIPPEEQGAMDWAMRLKVNNNIITHMFGTREQATEYFKAVADRQGYRDDAWYMAPKNQPPAGPSGPSGGPTQSYEVRQQPGNNYVTTVTASSPQEAVNIAAQRFPGYAGSMNATLSPSQSGQERRYRIQYGFGDAVMAILYARSPEEAVRIAAARDPSLDPDLIRAEVVESEELDEVSMSPGALADYAKGPFAQSMKFGFEAEMIVPDLAGEDDGDYDLEPDMSYDEDIPRFDTWADFRKAIMDFFLDNGANNRADIAETLARMEGRFIGFAEDTAWPNYARVKVRDWIADKYGDDWPDQLELFTKPGEDELDRVLRRREEFERKYTDLYYEKWFEDNEGEVLDDWLSRKGMDTLWDISQQWSLAWPYVNDEGGRGGMSVDDLAESWRDYSGAPAKVSSGYHSAQRDATHWIFEPDSSIRAPEGYGGIELISPPMPFNEGQEALDAFFGWAEEIGAKGNSSTGFHMGLSIPGHDLFNVDYVKLVLFLGDQYVLDQFNRSHNTYTESLLKKIQKDIQMGTARIPVDQAMDLLRKGMNQAAMTTLNRLTTASGRYVSVNIKSRYVEFRSAGGDFMANKDKLKNTLFRYVRALGIAADPDLERQEYAKKLYKLLATGLGDSGDTVKLFSMYAAGAINRFDLKQRLLTARVVKQQKKPLPKPEDGTQTWYPWTLVPLGDHSESNVLRFRARTRAEAEEYAADLAERHGIRTYELESGYTESVKKNSRVKMKMNELKRRKGKEPVTEAFDKPYKGKWEKSEFGDQDMLVKLPDGTNLSIMFNHEGDDVWQVEFWRGASQNVTGEGDSQRIFATVISAIQKFIMKQQPWRIIFSASKDVDPGKNPESRAKLYNSLIARYAREWGYDEYNEDQGDQVTYELTRIDDETVTEGPVWNKVKNTAVAGAMAAGLGMGGAHLAAKTSTEPAPLEKPAATMQAEPTEPLAVSVSKEAPKAEPKADEEPMPSTATAADPKIEKAVMIAAQQAGLQGEELAQFMAQAAHETLGFQQMVEQGDREYFKKYDPKHNPKLAKILGNVKPGDGERYKGRGFLQITGRDNYKRAGKALGLPLEQKPQLAERPEVAAKIAIWYWNNRVKTKIDDFSDTIGVTSRINPNMRGLGDRDLNFQSYLKKFNVAKSESQFTSEQINAMLGGHLMEDQG